MATAFNEDAYQARVNQIPGYDSPYGNKPSAPTPMASTAPSTAPAQTPRAQFVADQNAKLAAANAKLAERTQEMNARYQPALNSPTNTFPANRLPVESGAASVQQEVTPPPDAAQIASDREAFKSFGSGFAGGVDNLARAAGDVLGLPVRGLAGVADTALVRPARAMGLNVPYMSPHLVPPGVNPSSMTPFMDAKRLGETAPNVETSTAAPERTLEQLGKQLGGLDRQHAQNVQLQAAARTPEQARAEVQQTEGLAQVRGLPGVYQHGRGQYSDNPEGMGFATGFTGQPSAQNMQAANALASQQQAQSMARLQAAERQAAPQARGLQGFEMPRQESAYEREARQRERNRIMGMLQTPLTGDPRRDLTSSQRQQLVAQLGQESQERQATERNMFGLAGQQLNAEAQRYSTDANTAVGADRNTIDQQRVGMEATTKGVDVRQAQRKQSFQEAWAKGTKEQREQLQQMYPDLFGNEDKKKPYSFDVVRGSVDPMTGKREGDYAVVVDPNTGQYRQVQIGGGAAVPTAAPQEASKSVL